MTGVFSGTIAIDRAFSKTIPFGTRLNLPILVRNPRAQSLTFENFRMPTSWKNAKSQGSSSGSTATFTVDGQTAGLIFCQFYVGPATDNVDAMRFTQVDLSSRIGGEHILFQPEDGDIELTVNLRFTIEGQDSGEIPIARYRIEQTKKRAIPYWIASDLQEETQREGLKLCELWGRKKASH
jgi:hypothetical protein